MARLVRASYTSTLPRQVARTTSRAMTKEATRCVKLNADWYKVAATIPVGPKMLYPAGNAASIARR
jgi:hypothetical protein